MENNFTSVTTWPDYTTNTDDVDRFERVADAVFGGVLAACSIFGIPTNLVAFYFFLRQTTSNKNAEYFKRIYVIISLTDLLICVFVVPSTTVLFTGNRTEPAIFADDIFCAIHGIIWISLQKMFVFLVGVMSMSRLYILIHPHKEISPYLAWTLPSLYLVLELSITFFFLSRHELGMHYLEHGMTCYIQEEIKFQNNLASYLIEFQHSLSMITANLVLESVQLGFPIVPVCMSCITSIILIGQTKKANQRARFSTHKQDKATWTIIIVTLVYTLFHIPNFLYHIYILVLNEKAIYLNDLYINASQESLNASETLENINMITNEIEQFQEMKKAQIYATPLTFLIFVALNSAINPLIYFYRMDAFKTFLLKRFCRRLT